MAIKEISGSVDIKRIWQQYRAQGCLTNSPIFAVIDHQPGDIYYPGKERIPRTIKYLTGSAIKFSINSVFQPKAIAIFRKVGSEITTPYYRESHISSSILLSFAS